MKITYRPEINGLRAVAVIAIILYHAKINILGHQLFKGGFIGVDVFFVISGYLITSIIYQELVTTDSFSFKHFYERRIRRILPALLFVMLVSLPLAWMFLLPNSFVEFSKTILYSLGFSSNFYFWLTHHKYGDESGLLKPFLHTWSLSAEEQFYILFPIVLLFTFKYFRKYLIHILILGFVISLGLADWVNKDHPVINFYLLPTRGWELLAGSILACFEITSGYRSKNKTLNLIFPTVGLFLIGYSIWFFKDEFLHPSFYTLKPIIGTCLIIWFSDKDELITKILSTKLFVGVGLISYSLYLWHYPIFAFARITDFFHDNLFAKLLLGILVLALSIFSYYFIEQPFRNKNNKFKVIINSILIFIFFLIIINFNILQKKGYKNRLPEILQKNLREDWTYLKHKGVYCFQSIQGCSINETSSKKVYLIGDSHMEILTFDLKDRLVKKNFQFIIRNIGACLFYPEFNLINYKTMKIDELCNNDYFQKLKQTLTSEKNQILIFGGRHPLYISNKLFENQENHEGGVEEEWSHKYVPIGKYETVQSSFKNEVFELSKYNKIILIYPMPEVDRNPFYFIYHQWLKKRFFKNHNLLNLTTSFEVYKKRTKSTFELLDSIQGKNIYRVYPHKLFCDSTIKDRCVTHDDKNIFYADNNHPSMKGGEMINDLIMKEIEKIEFKSN